MMFTETVAMPQNPPVGTYRVQVERSLGVNDIQGFVYDQAGEPVAGVMILAKNMATGVEEKAIAGNDGAYHFTKLRTAESYELTVTSPVFETFDVKGINIGWKLATHLDIVLRPK